MSFLRIQGLAVIDELELELGPGLNVLTGETGAGKSILVGALSLLRGGKLRGQAVRAERARASVQAQFVVHEAAPLTALLGRLELPATGDLAGGVEVLLERTLPRTGRGRSLIQGQLRPHNQLAEVGEELIDICGQHQQHSLAHLRRHLELLDEHITRTQPDPSQPDPSRPDASRPDPRGGRAKQGFERALLRYREEYEQLRSVERERQRLSAVLQGDPGVGDYLQHQLDELERIKPQVGEWERVSAALRVVRQGVSLAELVQLVEQILEEGEGAVVERVTCLERSVRAHGAANASLAPLAAELTAIQLACDQALQAARALRSADTDNLDADALELRLHQLAVLRRKHGDDLQAATARIAAQVAELRGAAERLEALQRERDAIQQRALAHARKLHRARRQAALELARGVEVELQSLFMPHARVEISVEELPVERLHPAGLDRVEIRVAANPGEATGPLGDVASGGELSRILLALQSVSQGRGGVSTYVFDEVDAGVGGAVADAIGRRLLKAARAGGGAQVICITHLPQVAAFADTHLRVEKQVVAGRTHTQVVALDSAARVEELARMLGGASVTDSAREHARRLLAEAAGGAQPAAAAGAAGPTPSPRLRSGASTQRATANSAAAGQRKRRTRAA